MSVGVPTNIWRRTSGNGELGSGQQNLVTLSGLQIITLSGLDLTTLDGTYTAVPATEWAVVEPVPVTEWRPTDGLGDLSNDGIFDISDPSGVLLVDTVGIQIVDTGVVDTLIPSTEWEQDDSI